MSLFDLDSKFIKENAIVRIDELKPYMSEAIEKAKKDYIEIKISNKELLSFNFDKLGYPLSLSIKSYHYKMLVKDFEKKYEYIYQQALSFHAQSIYVAKSFLETCKTKSLIKSGELLDTYIDKCSWAELMEDYILTDEELTERLDNEFPTEDGFDHLFTLALGCYLFNQVNEKLIQGKAVDMNLLGQAFHAIEFSHSAWSWSACSEDFSKKMSRNALKRLENDPVQNCKKEIQLHYESQKTQFKRRGFSAKFIREMHTKYPEIKDIKTIERLVAKLNKNNEQITPKPA